MNFGQSISTCMAKFADFSGRASRSEYWWFYLFVTLMSWGSSLVSAFMFSYEDPMADILPLIVSLVFFVPTIAAGSRRLHDIGKSGWWQLIAFTVIGIILLIVWYATDTKTEKNKFNV